MTDPRFEERLAHELYDFADARVRPFDALTLAVRITQPGERRGRLARPLARPSRIPRPWLVALAVLAMLIVALLAPLGAGQIPPGPGPSPTPSASPSGPSDVQVDRQGIWLSGPRDLPFALVAPDDVFLSLDARVATVNARAGEQAAGDYINAAGEQDGRLVLTTPLARADCARGSVGTYEADLSPRGTVMTLSAVADACVGRPPVFEGSWYRMACVAADSFCLGDLEAGEYRSWNLDLSLSSTGRWVPTFGALTYTVPDGWSNTRDYGAGYMLEPTAWFQDLVAREGADDGSRDPGHGIYVQSHPVAAVQPADCSLTPDETVGTSAQDLVEFLIAHSALEVTRRPDIEVGGFTTAVLDLAMAPDWTGKCPDVPGRRFAGLVVNGKPTAGFYNWGIADTGRSRYLIVDRGDGSPVLIDISAEDQATFDALLPDAMAVVETFRFTAES